MSEEVAVCKRCSGTGVELLHGKPWDCWKCGGSGLPLEPKFRATCALCGKVQPRAATGSTVDKWMADHRRSHRPNIETDQK